MYYRKNKLASYLLYYLLPIYYTYNYNAHVIEMVLKSRPRSDIILMVLSDCNRQLSPAAVDPVMSSFDKATTLGLVVVYFLFSLNFDLNYP